MCTSSSLTYFSFQQANRQIIVPDYGKTQYKDLSGNAVREFELKIYELRKSPDPHCHFRLASGEDFPSPESVDSAIPFPVSPEYEALIHVPENPDSVTVQHLRENMSTKGCLRLLVYCWAKQYGLPLNASIRPWKMRLLKEFSLFLNTGVSVNIPFEINSVRFIAPQVHQGADFRIAAHHNISILVEEDIAHSSFLDMVTSRHLQNWESTCCMALMRIHWEWQDLFEMLETELQRYIFSRGHTPFHEDYASWITKYTLPLVDRLTGHSSLTTPGSHSPLVQFSEV